MEGAARRYTVQLVIGIEVETTVLAGNDDNAGVIAAGTHKPGRAVWTIPMRLKDPPDIGGLVEGLNGRSTRARSVCPCGALGDLLGKCACGIQYGLNMSR